MSFDTESVSQSGSLFICFKAFFFSFEIFIEEDG